MAGGHPKLHASEHQSGGIDEIAQASLLPQVPILHNLAHRAGGTDALSELNTSQIGDGSVSLTEFYMLDGVNTASILVTKDMLDAVIQGLDWQESVLERRADPPGAPDEGDRYLVIATATGAWTGWEDSIVEWDSTAWIRMEPDPGFITLVEDESKWYMYDGTQWRPFSEAISHGDLLGLGEDDHTQYLLVNGTRAMTGTLQMGNNNISQVNQILPNADNTGQIGASALRFGIIYTPIISSGELGHDLSLFAPDPTKRIKLKNDTILEGHTELNVNRRFVIGLGRFEPRVISQTSEPSINNDELVIWEDTTVGEEMINLLYRRNGKQYAVELYPTSPIT